MSQPLAEPPHLPPATEQQVRSHAVQLVTLAARHGITHLTYASPGRLRGHIAHDRDLFDMFGVGRPALALTPRAPHPSNRAAYLRQRPSLTSLRVVRVEGDGGGQLNFATGVAGPDAAGVRLLRADPPRDSDCGPVEVPACRRMPGELTATTAISPDQRHSRQPSTLPQRPRSWASAT